MAGNSAFELVNERGWRSGLSNLSGMEFYRWWGTRLWWTMALMWTAIINMVVAGILWGSKTPPEIQDVLNLYGIFAGLFPPIAVVILMQDSIVGEKESGTAAWLLSKPVSRIGFILSKLLPAAVGVSVTMVLIPGLVAYAQFSLFAGSLLSPFGFLATVGVLSLIQIFFITLTVMLGTLFNGRGGVIGIPLAFNFLQQMLVGGLPFLANVLPWGLIAPPGDNSSMAVIGSFLLGETPSSLVPLVVIGVCIVIFTAVSVWKFNETEF